MENSTETYAYKLNKKKENVTGKETFAEMFSLPEDFVSNANIKYKGLLDRYSAIITKNDPGKDVLEDMLSKRENYADKPFKDVLQEFLERTGDNVQEGAFIPASSITEDLTKTFTPEELATILTVKTKNSLEGFASIVVAKGVLELISIRPTIENDKTALLKFSSLLRILQKTGDLRDLLRSNAFIMSLLFFLDIENQTD